MPFRYQCMECDQVFWSERYESVCPDCEEEGVLEMDEPALKGAPDQAAADWGQAIELKKNSVDIGRGAVCAHCLQLLGDEEDDELATARFETGAEEHQRSAFNPGRSGGGPRLCRRCDGGQ